MKAFVVMGRTLKAAYEDLFLCVFMSLVWWIGVMPGILPLVTAPPSPFGFTIPLLLWRSLAIWLVVLAPLTLALHHVANRMANYKRVDSSFFWEALRQHVGRGWLLFLLYCILPVTILFNVWFYMNGAAWALRVIGIAWLWVLLLVLVMSQYMLPLFWQQDEPSIKLILRNSLLLALRSPLYSFLMLLFSLLLMIIFTALALPLFLLGPAVWAVAANFGLVGLLQELGLAQEPPEVSSR